MHISVLNCALWDLWIWSPGVPHLTQPFSCHKIWWEYISLLANCFIVYMHSPNGKHLPVVRAVQWDCRGPLQNGGNSHRSRGSSMYCDWGNPNLYLDEPMTKMCYRSTRCLASYPTDSPNATRPGLCRSLAFLKQCRMITEWIPIRNQSYLAKETRKSIATVVICRVPADGSRPLDDMTSAGTVKIMLGPHIRTVPSLKYN